MKKPRSNVFIISAPSGTGKSTLIQMLLSQFPWLFFSISHTTRPPRDGEREGIEYHFVEEPQFKEMIDTDRFLEWAHVHGYYYGTSRDMLQIAEEQGKDLLLDVDIQGASKVRHLLTHVTSVFIMPPSYEVLKERLDMRKKDNSDIIDQRMENARKEIQHYTDYEYIIINEELGSAYELLSSIIKAQRCKRGFLQERIDKILKSFNVI